MGVSPMKGLRKKSLETPGSAGENVGPSRAGRPCHFRAIPPFAGRGFLPALPLISRPRDRMMAPDNREQAIADGNDTAGE